MIIEKGSDLSASPISSLIQTKNEKLRTNPVELINLRNVTDIPIVESKMAHSSGFRISK